MAFFGFFGWLSYIVTAIGIWLMVSPWVLGYADNAPVTMNSVIMGLVVAILSFIVGWVMVVGPVGLPGRPPVEK